MKREDNNLMNPPLEKLLAQIPQKYELVLTATRRAKQILREQRMLALNAEPGQTLEKPLSVALDDIVVGSIDRESLFAPDIELDEFGDEAEIFPNIDVLEGASASEGEGEEVAETVAAAESEEDDDTDDIDLEFNLIDDEPLEAD